MSTNTAKPKFGTKAFPTKRVVTFGILALLVLFAGYSFVRTFAKSEGTRTGLLFKTSRTGYVFKTYEGQLHLGGSAMMTKQSVWDFSIKDKAVYEAMQPFEGRQVKLFYKELVSAFMWQGNTNYIVYKVELADNGPLPGANTLPTAPQAPTPAPKPAP